MDESFYGCRACDYDLCEKCYSNGGVASPAPSSTKKSVDTHSHHKSSISLSHSDHKKKNRKHTLSKSQGVTCVAGHPLEEYRQNGGYYCADCGTQCALNLLFHGCSECDYDLCGDCYKNYLKDTGKGYNHDFPKYNQFHKRDKMIDTRKSNDSMGVSFHSSKPQNTTTKFTKYKSEGHHRTPMFGQFEHHIDLSSPTKSVSNVKSFLQHYGLEKYEGALKDAGFEDLDDLNDLGEEDIKYLIEEAQIKGSKKIIFKRAVKDFKTGKYKLGNKSNFVSVSNSNSQHHDDIKTQEDINGHQKHFGQHSKAIWKWKEAQGIWNEFEEDISNQIEKLQIGKSYRYTFEGNGQTYKITKLSNTTAVQLNTQSRKKREVIRSNKLLGMNEVEYPRWWDKSRIDTNYGNFELYPINMNSTPGEEIALLFQKTLPNDKIIKIESIQNQMLYDKWWNARKSITKLIGKHNLNERTLFHGTKNKDIMNIIQTQGFRKEYTTTAMYGEGTYFARDASYSKGYAAKDSNGDYIMFVTKVLCGEMCKGEEKYKLRAWPTNVNGGKGLIYDSLVDNTKHPSIFVIHDDVRAYPMFVVTFKRK